MLNYILKYPGRISTPDADYPYGGAQNITTPGDGTGTPWEEALINDILGFFQKMVTEASITPSGSSETVLASDLYDALLVVAGNPVGSTIEFYGAAAPSAKWKPARTILTKADYSALTSLLGSYRPDLFTQRTAANSATSTFYSVSWNGKIYVATGTSLVVQVSEDGINWRQVTRFASSSSRGGYAAAIGAFCSLGGSRTILTSPDGENWTLQTAAGSGSETFYDVASSNSLACVVGDSGIIQTSPDGLNWTSRTADGSVTRFRGIEWNGSVFCAVGDDGEIQTSPDGTTWTARTPAGSYVGDFYGVTWNGSVFCAVGASGEIQTSPDGTTWTARTPAGGFSDTFGGVGASVEHGTILTGGSNGELQTSDDDGVTWTARTAGGSATNTWFGIVFGDKFVVTGTSGGIQTTDGVWDGYDSATEIVIPTMKTQNGDGYTAFMRAI